MPPSQTRNDEPEPVQEESVPTDGQDIEGEELMKDVRNDKLEKPAPAPEKA